MTRSIKTLFTTATVLVAVFGTSSGLSAVTCPQTQSSAASSERRSGPRPEGRHHCSCGQSGHGKAQGQNRAVMRTAMRLVHEYRHSIDRSVVETDFGVITETRIPSDPEAAQILERHVRDMKTLLESDGHVRRWDPLFSEIFSHSDEIVMVVEPIEDGVRVTETSENPSVVKLIQAHAYKVNDFIARGPEAVHEPTPLPQGYKPDVTAESRHDDLESSASTDRARDQTTPGCFPFRVRP